MEMLSVNKGVGQSYGFVMYRTAVPKGAKQMVIRGLKDFGVVRPRDGALTLDMCSK